MSATTQTLMALYERSHRLGVMSDDEFEEAKRRLARLDALKTQRAQRAAALGEHPEMEEQ